MIYFNKKTGQRREVGKGFSWGAFVLGFFYYAYKGMWGKAVLYFAICLLLGWTIVVPIAMWIYFGMNFNNEYRDFLINEGYNIEKDLKK